ncbi:MAG: AmmeMemoRadiSam system radical SAM enzyme [Bacteroidales bacterium]|nr:AmmeMemoRadiSam system radical SAM enzyme [Bacteroidales bacterium]MBN2758301.1 AmmeMemoRadiSam system radical SAM enzyme [Bacteroidales bacterium]
MFEADFYKVIDSEKLQCTLCPHNCVLKDRQTGICKVRTNFGGKLIAENYGKISSYSFDPIEKKPLYHYFPGKEILSIGSVGCNLHCEFCQNHEISQNGLNGFRNLEDLSASSLINIALRNKNNIGIAYTYNEPLVFYEFMKDAATLAKQSGLKNVMVTNGFINKEPLDKIIKFIDAFSVDLKAFTEEFYKKQTYSKLQPVLENLKTIKKSGRYLEITNLIIPGLNDDFADFENMLKWIRAELGKDTVLHLSRYFPRYKMSIKSTSPEILFEMYELAKHYLDYVFIGNLATNKGQNTYCKNCDNLLIERNGYLTNIVGLTKNGECLNCKEKNITNLYN